MDLCILLRDTYVNDIKVTHPLCHCYTIQSTRQLRNHVTRKDHPSGSHSSFLRDFFLRPTSPYTLSFPVNSKQLIKVVLSVTRSTRLEKIEMLLGPSIIIKGKWYLSFASKSYQF